MRGGITKRQHDNIHQNIRYRHGKASKCQNPLCENKSVNFEWALIKGRNYTEDIKDYMQLCVSCHRKYDYTDSQRKKISDNNKGKSLHGRERAIIQLTITGELVCEHDSITLAAISIGTVTSSIVNCLSGRSHTAAGFKWNYKN